jgi:lysozyme
MKPRHKVSRAGMELIKSFEGYRPSAAQLADGRWTIGYGHTKTARQGAEVSEADAEALLYYDLIGVAAAVNDLTYTPLTQNQFDALVSFASNVGVEAFRKSIVLRRINEGSMLQAAWALEMWRKADFEGEQIVVDALVRRRAAEKALFLTPQDGWVAAPSPVLPPKFDADAGVGAPAGRPVELVASLVGETATVEREPQPEPAVAEAAPAQTAPAEPEPEPFPEAVEQAAATPTSQAAPVVVASQMADATETLSARLEALLPTVASATPLSQTRADLDLPSPPETPTEPMAEAPVAAEAATSTVANEPELFEHTATETRWSNPIAYAPAAANEPEAAHEAIPALADLFQRPIYREQALDDVDPFYADDVQPAKFGFAPFLVVAVVGLVIFAAATTWAFSARAGSGINPMAVGVPLAIVGIACVAWSVYALISRFSGHEE